MKILFDSKLQQLAFPAVHSGLQCFRHDPKEVATFDIFNKINPDVYIADLSMLTNAVLKNIDQRPHLKCIFVRGEGTEEKEGKVKNQFGNLFEFIDVPIFGDIFSYSKSEFIARYKSDIISIDIEDVIEDSVVSNKIYRIFHNYKIVQHPNYCGGIDPRIKKHIIKSSVACLSNQQDVYNIAIAGSLPVSIDGFDTSDRDNKIKDIVDKVFSGESSFHRVAEILNKLGLEKESKLIMNKIGDFK